MHKGTNKLKLPANRDRLYCCLIAVFVAFLVFFHDSMIAQGLPSCPPYHQNSANAKGAYQLGDALSAFPTKLPDYRIFAAPGSGMPFAFNTLHQLSANFFATGFALQGPGQGPGGWKIHYELMGVFRNDEQIVCPSEFPRVHISGQSMVLDHGNDLLVEYHNTEEGLRQNFIIQHRPQGQGQLRLPIRTRGSLYPNALAGNGVVLMEKVAGQPGVKRLYYKDLKVFDASGKLLSAKMRVSKLPARSAKGDWDAEIEIEVEDEDATYPLLIDPLSTAADWVVFGGSKNAALGGAVASAGDVNGDGYDDVLLGYFGYSNSFVAAGRSAVFHGSGSGLPGVASWSIEGTQANMRLGFHCAPAGDVNGDGYDDVVVGAPGLSSGNPGEGGAYVYHGSPAGLGPVPAWTAEGNQDSAFFGGWLASAGDVNGDGFADVLVGASGFDGGQLDEGKVFLYHGSATGLSVTANWTAEGDVDSAFFGNRVAAAGDVNGDGYSDVIVGCMYCDGGQPDEGRVEVYYGSVNGLSSLPDWTAQGGQAGAFFGCSVASAGDVNGDGYADVLVGAYGFDGGFPDEGRTFLYLGSASGLSTQPGWTFSGGSASAVISGAVAGAGDLNKDGFDDVLIGAGGISFPGPNFSITIAKPGKVFVFYGSALGPTTVPDWDISNDPEEFWFGYALASAGDVNGDGYGDVVIGAPIDSSGFAFEGAAYAYHGSPTGLESIALPSEPFTGYFQQDSSDGTRWVAGECAGSIPLPDGKTIWLFGRSYLQSVDANHEIGCGYQVSNCVLLQDNDTLENFRTLLHPDTSLSNRTLFRLGNGSPTELLPGDGYKRRDSVYVFLSARDSSGAFADTNVIARASYEGGITIMVIEDVKTFPSPEGIAFGTSVWVDSVAGWVYVFGSKVAGTGYMPYLARLPFDSIYSGWEYFQRDSLGARWDSLASNATPVSDYPVADNFDVVKIQDSYYLFSEEVLDSSSCTSGKKIQTYKSDSVTGPYQRLQQIYQVQDTFGGQYLRMFNVEVHPQFSNCDSLLISYNVDQHLDSLSTGGCPSQCETGPRREADTWRPKFLRVPYSLLDPALVTLPLPIAEFDTVQAGATWAFVSTSRNATGYLWDFDDGSTSTLENPSHTYAVSGNYTVRLEASNCVGFDRYFIDIEVQAPSSGFFPILSVFPNPSGGQFRVRASNLGGDVSEIEVYSLHGQRIFQRAEKHDRGRLDALIDLQAVPGIYVLRFLNEGKAVSWKLVVL